MGDIVQRLRGQYSVGPHEPNGSPGFGWRQFQATPINLEAADEIERLRTQLKDAQLPTAADVRGIMAHRSDDGRDGVMLIGISGCNHCLIARPIEEWHEDMGEQLWWRFPIDEAPYVGSPTYNDWPSYHTHFTPIPMPDAPGQK